MFTRELLAELNSLTTEEPWPPDMEAITSRLQTRFVALREQKETKQKPSYLWYRDWDSNEHMFSEIVPAPIEAVDIMPTPPPLTIPRELKISERHELIELFLKCKSIKNPDNRQIIILNLRPAIANSVARSTIAKIEVSNLIDTCRNYEGGLVELLDGIEIYESGSVQIKLLRQKLIKMLPEEVSQS